MITEVERVVNFQAEHYNCTVCGKQMRFWFNGGELSQSKCCGLIYRCEIARIDLVIYKRSPTDETEDSVIPTSGIA